jgi:hypothetical protein
VENNILNETTVYKPFIVKSLLPAAALLYYNCEENAMEFFWRVF